MNEHRGSAEDVHKALPDVVAELQRLDPKESKDSKERKKPKKWGVDYGGSW